jgi:hypothetical protein
VSKGQGLVIKKSPVVTLGCSYLGTIHSSELQHPFWHLIWFSFLPTLLPTYVASELQPYRLWRGLWLSFWESAKWGGPGSDCCVGTGCREQRAEEERLCSGLQA